MTDLRWTRRTLSWRAVLGAGLIAAAPQACVEDAGSGGGNLPMGASDFVSAPPGGQGGESAADGRTSAGADAGTAAPSADAGGASTTTTRAVEETDLYRLDGDRLYYLNGYRGLLVFDVSNVDAPRLLGRAPLFGSPVEMVVRGGVAYALVADWYGRDAAGRPFHGTVVRALDARDPAHITTASEAVLRGWVRDARVVGDVMYTVSEDYGGGSPYEDLPVGAPRGPQVVVSSISIADAAHVHGAGERVWSGYSGIFNVTQDAILMAHAAANADGSWASDASQVDYVDISDPAGAIRVRGSARIEGQIQGWGANNGRFNIDYDGRYVRALSIQYGSGGSSYRLTTVDARDPDAMTVASSAAISGSGWIPAARFDRGRMYLSPTDGYFYGSDSDRSTPVQIYDVSDPVAPRLAGQTRISGSVWNFIPAGDRLFALGNEASTGPYPYTSSRISLRFLDVSDASAPRVIGTSQFGEGWAWTPAAGDFKAFTMDAARGLVVLPFSGWDSRSNAYSNGLQLVEFNRDMIATAGTAHTRGWTERGIFVGSRLVSLSDLSLSVVDYADRSAPRLVTELTLARNIIATQPMGDTLVQVVSDWWGNESFSTVRVVPIGDPDDNLGAPALAEVRVEGTNARVFRNGAMAYVVTTVREERECTDGSLGPTGARCSVYAPQVSVVDLTVPRMARLRGTVRLPTPEGYYSYGYPGYYGWFGWYGWWDGESMVQVGGDVLAYREYFPRYDYRADGAPARRLDTSLLRVIDMANPDAPRLASTTVTPSTDSWWGNLRAVGNTLYASHYDYVDRGARFPGVRYYVDRFDLTDRAAPRVLSRVNVPGLMVGASSDQRYLYTIDYRWYEAPDGTGSRARNTFNVLELSGSRAFLRSTVPVDGYLGNVFVRGERAYFSAEHNIPGADVSPYGYGGTEVRLHALDLRNPAAPVDRAGASTRGWGWLLGLEGDRALVQSGWGAGVDVYRLADDRAPELLSFQRTRGWWGSNVSRQGDTMFLASGYWGVQSIDVGH